MTYFDAILLGVVQGLTEFIPVSSTAHLLVFEELLGLSQTDQVFSFSVIVQLGTVFSLLLFFWRDIWQITAAFLLGIYHRAPFENVHSRLGWLVVAATLPALLAGFLLQNIVQSNFEHPLFQAGVRLLVTSILLFGVEKFISHSRTLESATWQDALLVGAFQVLAIFPGASRSGSTIAGGMLRGFDRPSAARFAFLMSGPILLTAGSYEALEVVRQPGTMNFLPVLLTGFITSALVGWVAVKWLINYLSRNSMYVFAAYCVISSALLFYFDWMG